MILFLKNGLKLLSDNFTSDSMFSIVPIRDSALMISGIRASSAVARSLIKRDVANGSLNVLIDCKITCLISTLSDS